MAKRLQSQQRDPDSGPTSDDLDRFSGVTQKCPECRTELYDDVVVCWKCGHALTDTSARAPLWPAIVAVLLIVAMLFLTIRPF